MILNIYKVHHEQVSIKIKIEGYITDETLSRPLYSIFNDRTKENLENEIYKQINKLTN